MSEPLTPLAVEDKLRSLVTELTQAQRVLASARDAETRAEITYKRAEAAAFHRPDCPRVERGVTTVGDRDAWVSRQVMDEWQAVQIARTAREVAQDNLRVVLAIAETVRSLGASVRTAYEMAGRS